MRNRTLTFAVATAAPLTLVAVSLVLAYPPTTPGHTGTRQSSPVGPASRTDTVPPQASRGRTSGALEPAQDDRRSTMVSAVVEPSEAVEVVADDSGHIGRLAVDIGSAVRRGDLLAEIESPNLEFRLKKARVAVQQARARAATTRALAKVADTGVRTARAELEASQAALRQAEAAAACRKRQYDRIAELVQKGTLQNRIGEEEQARVRGDEASEQTAGARVAIMRASLATAEARLEAALAEVGEAVEAIHLAELEQEEAGMAPESRRVRSPIDGVVTRRHRHAGEAVRPGADVLFTIVGIRKVRVVAQVPDRDAPLVAVGDPATFRPEARPDTEFPGKVSRTAVAQDPDARTMRIEIDLDNGDSRLRPGQRGAVRIERGGR